jgi:RHS repeat-associated protein
MLLNEGGEVVYAAAFGPYGDAQEIWENNKEPNLKFSSKERDAETDLDYFGARYFDHQTARFNSVDPLINKDEALGNPQMWNLYAYCGNNPISNLDPSGRNPFVARFVNLFPEFLNFIDGLRSGPPPNSPGGWIAWLVGSIYEKITGETVYGTLFNPSSGPPQVGTSIRDAYESAQAEIGSEYIGPANYNHTGSIPIDFSSVEVKLESSLGEVQSTLSSFEFAIQYMSNEQRVKYVPTLIALKKQEFILRKKLQSVKVRKKQLESFYYAMLNYYNTLYRMEQHAALYK